MGPMGCPDRETLAAFNRGELSVELAGPIAAHVEGCGSCQSVLIALPELGCALLVGLRQVRPARSEAVLPTVLTSPPGTIGAAGPVGYELYELVGRGGMGVVHRARDVRLNREVAVKMLRDDGPGRAAARARFEAEAQITGQLQHPGIPAVHELGALPDGRPFLAMKLVKGRTLHELLGSSADLAGERGRFVAIFEQICHAVGYAHAHRVIHRDLKPANVMVGAFGEVQVMDWGLAKVLPREGGPAAEGGDGLPETVAAVTAIETPVGADSATRTGAVMGTPAFMPPEQAGGEVRKLDARSDVFGLGAILCQVLTGRPPYSGRDGNEVRLKAVRGELDEALGRLDGCGAEAGLVALCKRCLAFRQEDRPGDGQAVAEEVARIRQEAEGRARRAEQERAAAEVREAEVRKRRRVWLGLAASLLVGLIASAAMAVWAKAALDKETEAKILLAAANEQVSSEQQEALKANRKLDESLRAEQRTAYFNRIALARREWQEGHIGRVEEILGACPGFLRGWEWHYLRRQCHSELLTLRGHPAPVEAVAFLPDGRLVSVSEEESLDKFGLLRVWDLTSGRATLELRTASYRLHVLAVSADGRYLAAGGELDGVIVWDVRTGKVVRRIKEPAYYSVALSPDGTRVALGVYEGVASHSVRVYDVASGAVVQTLGKPAAGRKECGHVWSVAYHPGGKQLLTLSDEEGRRVTVWDLEAGKETCRIPLPPQGVGSQHAAVYSPDGKRVAADGGEGVVKIWDGATGKEVLRLPTSGGSLAFHRDGRFLAIVKVQAVEVWDTQSGKRVRQFRGHDGPANSACFGADGRLLASAGRDGTVKLWDWSQDQEATRLAGLANEPRGLAFSPDGRWVAVGDLDGGIKHLEAFSGKVVWEARGHDGAVAALAYSPDGKRITSASNGLKRGRNEERPAEIKVWSATTGAELHAVRRARAPAQTIRAVTSDGLRVVLDGLAVPTAKPPDVKSRALSVWDARTGDDILLVKGVLGVPRELVLSADGRRIAVPVHGQPSTLSVWDLPSGKPLLSLRGHGLKSSTYTTGSTIYAAFNGDGSRVACANVNRPGEVGIWDVEKGQRVLTFQAFPGNVHSLAFSPNGSRVATLGPFGPTNLKLFDAETGAEALTLESTTPDGFPRLVFSPDGTALAGTIRAAGEPGMWARLVLWNAKPLPEPLADIEAEKQLGLRRRFGK